MELDKEEIIFLHSWKSLFQNGFVFNDKYIDANIEFYSKYIDAGYMIIKKDEEGSSSVYFTDEGIRYIDMMMSFYDL